MDEVQVDRLLSDEIAEVRASLVALAQAYNQGTTPPDWALEVARRVGGAATSVGPDDGPVQPRVIAPGTYRVIAGQLVRVQE